MVSNDLDTERHPIKSENMTNFAVHLQIVMQSSTAMLATAEYLCDTNDVQTAATKDAGTKDGLLMRVILTRCEVDLVEVKQEFQRLSGKTLESWIEVQQKLLNVCYHQWFSIYKVLCVCVSICS